MEASRPPVEELWCTVYSRGVCPKKSMPQYKWRKQISNFTPNFIPPPKEGEVTENNSSGSDGAQGTNEVSYDVFLSMEGRLTAENPYKEEIMNTPLQLPRVVDVKGLIWGDLGLELDPNLYGRGLLAEPNEPKQSPVVEDYVLIDSYDQLKEIVDEMLLRKLLTSRHREGFIDVWPPTPRENYSAVGMDVEHHSGYSYRGVTCLVQLATPRIAYMIDPFNMFSQMHILNKLTTNPKILKIFHHARLDVAWLQRDFGIYIVNAFDTGIAASVLGFPEGSSLKKVLKGLFGVEKQEELTRADWTQRPLPRHLLEYAALDVKYLFRIYGSFGLQLTQLAEEEAGKARIQIYEQQVKQTFSKAYNYPSYNAKEEAQMYFKGVPYTANGLGAALLAWRDIRARHLDVGRHYLIPKMRLAAVLRGNVGLRLAKHRELQGPLADELRSFLNAHRSWGAPVYSFRLLAAVEADEDDGTPSVEAVVN